MEKGHPSQYFPPAMRRNSEYASKISQMLPMSSNLLQHSTTFYNILQYILAIFGTTSSKKPMSHRDPISASQGAGRIHQSTASFEEPSWPSSAPVARIQRRLAAPIAAMPTRIWPEQQACNALQFQNISDMFS